jgi:hypothetical protein
VNRTACFAAVTLAAFVSVACGSGPSTGAAPARQEPFGTSFVGADLYPVVVSSELVVGENRFLVGLLDEDDAPVADPAIELGVSFYDLNGAEPAIAGTTDLSFLWTLKPRQGLWAGEATFDRAGRWGAEIAVKGGGYDETLRTAFDVAKEGSTPAIGAPAPASDTPTAADVGELSEITTDDDPDPRFYSTSIADALRRHEPFVVVFATPKFCTSQVCGPTLDTVKTVSRDFPRLTFIHVEVYTNLDDPSNLQTVPAVEEWGLPTEPWVFVVDADGRVVAKYEGVVGKEELKAQLRHL